MQALGANALATARIVDTEVARQPATAVRAIDTAATLDELPVKRGSSNRASASSAQTTLFGAELQPKIIPFETLPRTSTPTAPAAPPDTAVTPKTAPATKPRRVRREQTSETAQTTLDFLPPLKTAPKTTKTNAEAVIFCDAAVAAPIHRATAAALDLSMILIAFGAFLAGFQYFANPQPMNRLSLVLVGGMLVLFALLYGLLFAVCADATPGMRWTHLRLIDFDGFVPEPRSRALRFAGCWISLLSGGLGLAWSLLDEENLTWHDHMSQTFPTLRESESVLVRR